MEPTQDWDLAVASMRPNDVLLECTADDTCPGRDYLLAVLYLIIGDAARSNFNTHSRDEVDSLLLRSERYNSESLKLWYKRSLELLEFPEKFAYVEWCDGGLARTPGS